MWWISSSSDGSEPFQVHPDVIKETTIAEMMEFYDSDQVTQQKPLIFENVSREQWVALEGLVMRGQLPTGFHSLMQLAAASMRLLLSDRCMLHINRATLGHLKAAQNLDMLRLLLGVENDFNPEEIARNAIEARYIKGSDGGEDAGGGLDGN